VIRSAATGQTIRELPVKVNGFLIGWAPDNRSLLVTGADFRGRMGAYSVNAETGDTTLLFENSRPNRAVPQWSPDGRSIYYVHQDRAPGQYAIVRRDVATGAEKELIRHPFLSTLFLSPDGKYVATVSADAPTNSRVLLLIPANGGESREVMRVASGVAPEELTNTGKGQLVYQVTWAPDSRSFIFRKRRSVTEDSELWVAPVDGGAPRRLDGTVKANTFKFSVSPDSRQVAFRFEEPVPRQPEIWALENFLPAESKGK
jgi:Tol biopolymer transport system component